MAFRRTATAVIGSALILGAIAVAPSQAAGSRAVTLQISGFGNVFEPKIVMKYGMITNNKPWQKIQASLIKQGKLKVLHPNIKLDVIGSGKQPDDAWFKLSGALAGRNVPDVAAIEMSHMGETRVKATANQFVDLNSVGAKSIQSQYLPFRYAQGESLNGHQIGIPTDVGGLAIAYRTDLFKQAGFPTDRKKVAKLWPTWEKFIATGKKFQAKSASAFLDSSGSMYAAILNQGTSKYANPKTKKYDYKKVSRKSYKAYFLSSKSVRRAFDLTVAAGCTSRKNGKCSGSIGTRISQYNTAWGAAIQAKVPAFATVLAPAWALDYIKQFAPGSARKWDVAAAPGIGGNLGGSMLAIPRKSVKVKEAWDFIKWYLAPQQQLDTFKQYGLFPTTYKLYSQPAIKGYKDRFFSNAPLGQIYAASALKLKPIYAGPRDRPIDDAFGRALSRVSFGQQTQAGCGAPAQSAEAAWCQAISDIDRIGLVGK